MSYRTSTAGAGRLTVSILAVALALTLDASAHHGTTFFSRDLADMVTIQGRVTRQRRRTQKLLLSLLRNKRQFRDQRPSPDSRTSQNWFEELRRLVPTN